MTERHITNPRDRATKKYKAIHAQLERDVAAMRKPSLAKKSAKQTRHFAKSELYRMHAETP